MAPSRKPLSLRKLEREWCELEGIELAPGERYLIALTLLRQPGRAELDMITDRMRGLVSDLRRDKVKAHAVLLTPGERLQVFALDAKAERARRRRRRHDDDTTDD